MKNKERLIEVLYSTYNTPLSKVKSLKDYYKTFIRINTKNLDLKHVEMTIEDLKWALDNPKYDFNSILETDYTNKILYQWFEIYHKHLQFIVKKNKEGQYIITADDIPDDY